MVITAPAVVTTVNVAGSMDEIDRFNGGRGNAGISHLCVFKIDLLNTHSGSTVEKNMETALSLMYLIAY